MATLTATCDKCGKEIKGEEIFSDYGGIDYCELCYTESELYYCESGFKDKLKWLKETWIEDLVKKRKKLLKLRKRVKELKNE